jgi:hypothetical protein
VLCVVVPFTLLLYLGAQPFCLLLYSLLLWYTWVLGHFVCCCTLYSFAILGCSAILFVVVLFTLVLYLGAWPFCLWLYSLLFCYTWVFGHFEHMIFKWVKVNSVWTHSLWTWSVYIQTNLGSPTKFSGGLLCDTLMDTMWHLDHSTLWLMSRCMFRMKL